jgi:hypothetical protein
MGPARLTMSEFNEVKPSDSPFVLDSLSSCLRVVKDESPEKLSYDTPSTTDGSLGLSGRPKSITPQHAHLGSPPYPTGTIVGLPLENSTSPDDGALLDSDLDDSGLGRKKRKRNKPTLSCSECVEKKIKVCQPVAFAPGVI